MRLDPRSPLYWLLFGFVAATAGAAQGTSLAPWLIPSPDAVVNGRAPEPGSAISRSTVLLISAGGGSSCSGTVIGRDLIVTAGHCVTHNNSNALVRPASLLVDFAPYYNGSDSLPRASSVRVQAIRLHPRYNHHQVDPATYPHDVALVRLAGPIRPGYVPANFLPRSVRVSPGDSVVAAGYGDRSFKSTSPDYRLLTFDFRVGSVPAHTTLVTLNATRQGGIGSGDSGGPAWVRKNGALYFWGVASSGEEEGMAEAAYENLAAYRGWLEQAATAMGSSLRLP